MLKKFLLFHFSPFVLSMVIVLCLLFSMTWQTSIKNTESIQLSQTQNRGRFPNLKTTISQNIFLGSINYKEAITIFGSSEFSESPYCSYYFVPDSTGRSAIGIGHAGHQHFSIFIELLFANSFLENAKTVILISPTWFETEGTHPEAFLEFADKNILASIINDSSISNQRKAYIGKFIHHNHHAFEGFSNEMEILTDIYNAENNQPFLKYNAILRQMMKDKYLSRYAVKSINRTFNQPSKASSFKTVNFKRALATNQSIFVSSVTNNSMYVYNEYYEKYLLKDDGLVKRPYLEKLTITNNKEYEDFMMVLELMSEMKMDASFVIIPVNPYYYKNPQDYLPLIEELAHEISEKNFHLLNLFVSDTNQYEPGILRDIMHVGDYGWLKINQFIDSVYHE